MTGQVEPAPVEPAPVEPARPGDVAALVALIEAAYRGEPSRAGWTTEADLLGGQRTDAAAVAALVASGSMLIRRRDGVPVACCQLEIHGELAYFGTFAVLPTEQGSGIGSRLIDIAEKRAAAAGCDYVEMTVIAQRSDLIAWYGRRGYQATGETRPFPYGDERFGLPLRADLHFVVLRKSVQGKLSP